MSNEAIRDEIRRETAMMRESARGGMLRRLGSGSRLPVEDSTREPEESWLMTYLDLITLLLVLFVLLLAYADQGGESYSQMIKAMAEATRQGDGVAEKVLVPLPVGEPVVDVQAPQLSPVEPEAATDTVLEGMQQDLLSQFAAAGMESGVEVMLRKDQLDIQLSEQILFASGEARLRNEASRALSPIAEVFRTQPYDLTVEGHTDNIPIATEQFPSNWELSVSRASYVVRFLIGQGIEPERLRAVGYADTRPIGDNATDVGRAKNRRVTLIIHQQQQDVP